MPPALALGLQPERTSTAVRDDPGGGLALAVDGHRIPTKVPGGRVMVAKEDRGFASMDRSKQREIASKGGKAAHQKGTAHEWTSEEAREAGRKGGMASHRRKQEQTTQQTSSEAVAREMPSGTIGEGEHRVDERTETPRDLGGRRDVRDEPNF